MSKNTNGHIRDSLDLYKSEKDTEGSSSEIEQVFRGFQQKPVVVCEKYDIKPYLHKMELDLPLDLRGPIFVAAHEIANYVKKCSVRLRRENLEQLKEEFMSKRHYAYTTSFTCNICQKVYLSEKQLLNHQETKHVISYKPENKNRKKVSFSDEIIVHEVTEYHRCRKCPKIFEDYDSLRVHRKEIHKKRRCYVCFYCSKDFIDRMFFKLHIKLHCDACGLLLPNRKRYLEHRRNTCKIVKKYVCKTCHISLFYFMDLKDHSYEHLGQFYICDICKDRFDDKCALSHHIKFLHAKRRPKTLYTTHTMGEDTVYVCKFCDVSYAERELIDKHVSTFPEYNKCAMTGYKDFYFCDQCFEKFSTETDMLQHKWSHFLKSAQENVADLPKPVNLLNKMEILTDNMTQKPQSNNTEDTAEILIDSTTHNTQIMDTQPFKLVYNIKTDKLPPLLQPRIVLDKLVLPQKPLLEKLLSELKNKNTSPIDMIDLTNLDPKTLKKPIVAANKRTLLSKHQCQLCLRYLSNGSCLKRHLYAIHGITKDSNMPYKANPKNGELHCSACEEDFALPSLLQNHNCIRINLPEMPFQDARPDIHLDTGVFSQHNDFDNIAYNDDYMNSIDFEIPAPIVELTEYENVNLVINDSDTLSNESPFNGMINRSIANNDGQLNNVFNNTRPVINFTINNNRQLNNVMVNNDRQLNDAVSNHRQYVGPVNDVRPFTNVPVNNFRPFNNMPVNNVRQYFGTGNNLSANNVRPFTNVPVNNHWQLAGPLNHMTGNHVRPLNNLIAVNNDRQLNNLPVNGPLNNVQSNDMNSGKQYRYIYVQEVPIEF